MLSHSFSVASHQLACIFLAVLSSDRLLLVWGWKSSLAETQAPRCFHILFLSERTQWNIHYLQTDKVKLSKQNCTTDPLTALKYLVMYGLSYTTFHFNASTKITPAVAPSASLGIYSMPQRTIVCLYRHLLNKLKIKALNPYEQQFFTSGF